VAYLSPRDTFALFNPPVTAIVSWAGSPAQLVAENPDRIAVAFTNPGTSAVSISTRVNQGATDGHVIPAQSLPLIFNNRDHGPLSQIAWYACAPATPGRMIVTEVILERYPSSGAR
jgi:hypothetical protein